VDCFSRARQDCFPGALQVDKLERLAESAHDGKMSVQKLRGIVSKEVMRTKSTRGRKPKPKAIKMLSACVRTLRDGETRRLAIKRDDIDGLDDRQFKQVVDLTEALFKRLDELSQLLDRCHV
jgi:glutamyl-tRNA reductase